LQAFFFTAKIAKKESKAMASRPLCGYQHFPTRPACAFHLITSNMELGMHVSCYAGISFALGERAQSPARDEEAYLIQRHKKRLDSEKIFFL
jgi:hypothetical protein